MGTRTSTLSPVKWAAGGRVPGLLRKETAEGGLLLLATIVALLWANTPISDSYFQLSSTEIGPAALHLNLTVAQWAGDGLLAIFFFVAGIELKREFVAGDLRDPRRAVVPVAAALGGMIAPALLYLVIAGGTDPKGWAIPTATDIAFAVAALAVISTHLPAALRTFLLTLAVVDDLLAITIIALFYTGELQPGWLLLALVPLAVFTMLVQRRITSWWLLLPLAFATWSLVHASGVHATVAGVLLGFAVPVRPQKVKDKDDDRPGMAAHFEHLWRPISAGVALLGGIGFTVSMLIGELAFGASSSADDHVKIAVLTGSVAAAMVAAVVLRMRNRRHRNMCEGATATTAPIFPGPTNEAIPTSGFAVSAATD